MFLEKESWQTQLGRIAVVKAGAYIVTIDRKTTVYRLEGGEIMLFYLMCTKLSMATHSCIFTDLPVSWSLYHLYGSRARLHNSV